MKLCVAFAMVDLAVRSQTGFSSRLGFKAEVLEDKFFGSLPYFTAGPVLARTVALVESHADVTIGWWRPEAGNRFGANGLRLLGRRSGWRLRAQLNQR